jgi:hypothetical protein
MVGRRATDSLNFRKAWHGAGVQRSAHSGSVSSVLAILAIRLRNVGLQFCRVAQ